MKNKHDKKNEPEAQHGKITEKEIQRRLYGDISETVQPDENALANKYREDDIQKKLYGTAKPAEPKHSVTANESVVEKKAPAPVKEASLFEKKAPPVEKKAAIPEKNKPGAPAEKELFTAEPAAVQHRAHDELIQLNKSIAELEEKLKKTENRNRRLMVRLAQKRMFIDLQKRVVESLLNKNVIIALSSIAVCSVLVSGIIAVSQRVKTAPKPEAPAAAPKPAIAEEKKAVIVAETEPQPPAAKGKYYVIQVAEYADESAAQFFADTLKAKGYAVSMDTIYRSGNREKPYFKINVGSFGTYAEAKQFNEEFKKKMNIGDSFIKEKK
ncbi:MAG: SPOR domain-containing protein [Candidatus Omnitrophica bacterium]|jgi:Sporulation related domain.|nr:SPOR domain-containing protein [Candidatus Omnitrophota bacterium]